MTTSIVTRVVSLVPSVTETLAAWGLDPIACTRFCERPDLLHVGGTKNPDIDAIVTLEPDLVVLDRQENRREDAEALVDRRCRLCVLDVRSVERLDVELAALAAAVGLDRPPPFDIVREPIGTSAFTPIWRRPWMTIGPNTYGSSVLAVCGVRNVFDDADDDYPEVGLDEVAAREPDVVLVPSEPYAFGDDHLDELGEIAPVVRVDGQDLFWWGARTPAAIDRLRSRLSAR